MGAIKEGTITGNLPDTTGFAVHYPGYPSSTSRAIQTLGGTHAILKARSAQSNNLELHFRPKDPYSHPAFGERKPCNNCLLKICKRKDINGQEKENPNGISQCLSEEKQCQSKSTTDATGDKSELPEEGMVDYQHVHPVHAEVARKKKRTWEDMESQFDKDEDDLLMPVPPLFSMKNVPARVV